MKSRNTLSAALFATLVLSLAACSGSSATSAASSRKPKPAPTGQPQTGAAAVTAVKSAWTEFFNGNVPIPRRLKLLQNGQAFASFVSSQEKTSLGALVFQASGTVSSVRVQSAIGQATVVYTILLGGKPLETNLHGTAIYSGGRWLVSDGTFCGLVRLAYGAKNKLIPSVCGS
jgi:hypothetical protein